MSFNRRIISKRLDFPDLQNHNDNYADIETTLDAHDIAVAASASHIADGTIHTTTAEKTKLSGIATSAGTAGSATDTVIGSRTATDAVTPGLTGTVTALLSSLFTLIKGITGKSSALTAPAITLEATKTHVDDTVVHITAAERTGWNNKVDKVTGKQLSAEDYTTLEKTKLTEIETGAEVNQNAFSQVNDILASEAEDSITITGGIGITVSNNPDTKTVTVTATGEAAPGAHASTHITGGSDVIPDAVTGGSSGLMSGADATFVRSTGETKTGAQAKADAAQTAAATDATTKADAAAAASIPLLQKGAASGVATLDPTKRLPVAQLPVSVPQQTIAALTYYVRPDGSDANSGLANTAGGAFKTIQHAIDLLPKVIEHTVNVYIADGTYAENVSIKGFRGGGSLTINGNAANAALVMVTSIDLYGDFLATSLVSITATATTRDSFVVNRCTGFRINDCRSTSTALGYSGIVTYFSVGVIANGTYSNKGCGINCTASSVIDVVAAAGTGNTLGLGSADGAVVTKSALTLTGTQVESAPSGTITIGVLNPWGDNTTQNRTGIFAYKSLAQSIPPSVFTKVAFQAKLYDYLNEFNTATGTFTAKQAGIYKIYVKCFFNAAPTGANLGIRVFKGGGSDVLSIMTVPITADTFVSGEMTYVLAAGDTLEVYVQSSVSTNINPAADVTATIINRIA